jgi:hypothetical protein
MQDTAAWRVSQLTDGELVSRRTDIEGKLKVLVAESPRASLLRGELDDIAAEVADRIKIRSGRSGD